MNYLVLQLTAEEAVFARFHKRRGSLTFTGGGRHILADGEGLAEFLAQVKQGGLEQEQVIFCLPPGSLFMREVDLPLTDRRKIRSIIPLELKGETAVDTDDLVFDGIPLPGGKVLAVWVKRKEVAESIELLKTAGLEPEVVTASLFHWQTLVASLTGTCAVTDGTALSVFQDGVPLFFRPLQEGDWSEISRTIAAVELGKGVAVATLFVHGAAAGKKEAAPEEDIPVALIPIAGDLAAAFPEEGSTAVDMAGAYAVARACMIGTEVNFRTGELAYTAGRDRMRRKLRLTMILAVACVLLVVAEAAVRYVMIKRDLASVNRSISAIYREVFPTRKKAVDEVAELRSEIRRLGGGTATGSTLDILNRLAEAKGDDVTALFEIEVEGNQVRVKGDARSVQAVNDFKAKASSAFPDAAVGEIRSRPDGNVTFVFRGTLKGDSK